MFAKPRKSDRRPFLERQFHTGRFIAGYQLTLRQDKPDAIAASIAAHSILFDKLKEDTLQTYAIGQSDADLNTRLRNCAVDALTRSLRSASNGFGLALP